MDGSTIIAVTKVGYKRRTRIPYTVRKSSILRTERS